MGIYGYNTDYGGQNNVSFNEKSAYDGGANALGNTTLYSMWVRVCAGFTIGEVFRLGLYDDGGAGPVNLLGQTNEITSAGESLPAWFGANFESPVAILDGEKYWLTIHGNSTVYYCQTASGGTSKNTDFVGDSYSNGLSDPWGTIGSLLNNVGSIYASEDAIGGDGTAVQAATLLVIP